MRQKGALTQFFIPLPVFLVIPYAFYSHLRKLFHTRTKALRKLLPYTNYALTRTTPLRELHPCENYAPTRENNVPFSLPSPSWSLQELRPYENYSLTRTTPLRELRSYGVTHLQERTTSVFLCHPQAGPYKNSAPTRTTPLRKIKTPYKREIRPTKITPYEKTPLQERTMPYEKYCSTKTSTQREPYGN